MAARGRGYWRHVGAHQRLQRPVAGRLFGDARGGRGPVCPLFDPGAQQGDGFGGQRIAARRHPQIGIQARYAFDEWAFVRFAGDDGDAVVPAP